MTGLPEKLRKHAGIRKSLGSHEDGYQFFNEAAQLIEDLKAQNEALKKHLKWQPIETAPKEDDMIGTGGIILAEFYTNCDNETRLVWSHVASKVCGEWCLDMCGLNISMGGHALLKMRQDATHWMPLPAPPREGK